MLRGLTDDTPAHDWLEIIRRASLGETSIEMAECERLDQAMNLYIYLWMYPLIVFENLPSIDQNHLDTQSNILALNNIPYSIAMARTKAELPHPSPNSSSASISSEDMEKPKEESEPISRSRTQQTMRSIRNSDFDGAELMNLPSRTLNSTANLGEYFEETVSGQITQDRRSKNGKIEKYELVTWKVDDPENPKNWSKAYKWCVFQETPC